MARSFSLVLCLVVLSLCNPVAAWEPAPSSAAGTLAATRSVPPAALWRDPGDASALDIFYGSGGKKNQPVGAFTFVKEDRGGSCPKFEIVDARGVRWKVKLGEEGRSETAATRLLWAAGYFTDDDYYLPELRVRRLPALRRGRQFVSAGGIVRGTRLERNVQWQRTNWSWFSNPLEATRELNGLRVMMALLNNWDLKKVNNAIYKVPEGAARYLVTDLGATFGRSGTFLSRSKSNLKDYRNSRFIQKVTPEYVDFYLRSRPFFLMAVHVPNYVTRTRMQGVVKHIPRTHARWIGRQLGRLSSDQIRDCFRAAGYSPQEVEGFASVVSERIAELNHL